MTVLYSSINLTFKWDPVTQPGVRFPKASLVNYGC